MFQRLISIINYILKWLMKDHSLSYDRKTLYVMIIILLLVLTYLGFSYKTLCLFKTKNILIHNGFNYYTI